VVEHIASPKLILPNREARGYGHNNIHRDEEQFARRRLLWALEEVCSHINLLKIEVAFLALQYFLRKRVLLQVLIRLDNQTAISYLNHMALPLCLLALKIWNWCFSYLITFHADVDLEQRTFLQITNQSQQQQLGTLPVSV